MVRLLGWPLVGLGLVGAIAACQAAPPDAFRTSPPDLARPAAPEVPPPAEFVPGPAPLAFARADQTRPPWHGQREIAGMAPVRSYPATYHGDLDVSQLAMVGQNLYTVDGALYQVPVASGSWQPVSAVRRQDLTALASDGEHLFLGTRAGDLVGYDPRYQSVGQLGQLGSGVSAVRVGPSGLVAGTLGAGVVEVPFKTGSSCPLQSDPAARQVLDVAIGKKVAYSLGDRVYTWPLDGTPGHAVPGTEGATSLTSYQGNLFVGTADGWLLCSQDDGNTVYPLADVQPTPLSVLGTDGAWLYAGSGNSTYMLNLKNGATSLCHPGFAAPVTNLTVLNGAEVLVGTQGKGLTWMPR